MAVKQIILMVLISCSQCRQQAVMDLPEFIAIPQMRMDEYNFWYHTRNIRECAKFCVEEKRMFCRSFSYSENSEGCGTYEHARDSAPEGIYKGHTSKDGVVVKGWTYYERKTKNYKKLEEKLILLQNLTEISAGDAGELLSELNSELVSALNATKAESSEKEEITAAEIGLVADMIERVADINPTKEADLKESKMFVGDILRITNTLINPTMAQKWRSLQKDESSRGVTGVVASSETVARDVSGRLLSYENSTDIYEKEDEIGIWMNVIKKNETSHFSKSSRLHLGLYEDELDEDVFVFTAPSDNKESSNSSSIVDNTVVVLPSMLLKNNSVVSNIRYKQIQNSMPTRASDIRNALGIKYEMNSAVISTSIHPIPGSESFESNPVIIVFQHDRLPNVTTDDNEETIECVYWENNGKYMDSGWSTKGCEKHSNNETHTICKCTHLTSFAVLMKIVDRRTRMSLEHMAALSWISTIGCVLSLVGVTLMCGTFVMLKFRTENMKIHFNLGVAVGCSNLLFLFIEPASKSVPSCIVIAIFLYYFNMSVLSWMLIEGLYLYFQVVVVFVSARRWVPKFVIAGWGIPLAICVIAMGVLNIQLKHNENCWLSAHDNSIWAFAGPAILVIAINTFVLASVVRIIFNLHPDKNRSHIRKSRQRVRNAIKGSLFLSPLLGTTWLFGLISLTKYDLLFQYLFATTNSLQGFFLFLFHCVCNHEVREDFGRIRVWSTGGMKNSQHHSKQRFGSSFGIGAMVYSIRRLRNSIVSFDHPSTVPSSVCDSYDNPQNNGKYAPSLPPVDEAKQKRSDDGTGNKTSFGEGNVTNAKNSEKNEVARFPDFLIRNDTIARNKVSPLHATIGEKEITPEESNLNSMFTSCDESGMDNEAFMFEECKKEVDPRIQMSYDSGLNSIENDSILDEEIEEDQGIENNK